MAQRTIRQQVAAAPLGLIAGVLLLPLAATFVSTPEPAIPASPAPRERIEPQPPSEAAEALSSVPTALRIPKLELSAPFEAPLGLRDDGQVEVPEQFDTVGWYEPSPAPGALGPAVVLGHVDSRSGPAVFYSLGQLIPGDVVLVDRSDGETVRFEVTHLERYRQDGFPTEDVYGNIDHAGLRLITCSGDYDRETGRYSHNLIVFAKMVTEERSRGPL